MLEEAVRALKIQMSGLDGTIDKLKQRDRKLFKQMVSSIRSNNMRRASILANEIAQVRKIIKNIMQAKLALERIIMRIGTIRDMGDIVATLAPAVSAIKSVQGVVATVIPKADENFSEISNLLSSILVDAGNMSGFTLDFKAASIDAEKILEEAAKVAEEELKSRLPELPPSIMQQKAVEVEYA